MKKILIKLTLFIIATFQVSAQDCRDIEASLEQYETNYSSKLKENASETLIKNALKFLFGKAGSLARGFLKDGGIGSMKEVYINTLNRIDEEVFDKEVSEINKQKVLELTSKLVMANEGIKVEKEFGSSSECYASLKELTNQIIQICNEIGIDESMTCDYFPLEAKSTTKGERCGKESSYEVNFTNTFNYRIRVYCSFQNKDGTWRKWVNDASFGDGIREGESLNFFICEGTGRYVLVGARVYKGLTTKCRPKDEPRLYGTKQAK